MSDLNLEDINIVVDQTKKRFFSVINISYGLSNTKWQSLYDKINTNVISIHLSANCKTL